MGIGPATAIRALLETSGLSLKDIGRFEINEAFAAQIIGVERDLGLDRSRLNVNGGAIAMAIRWPHPDCGLRTRWRARLRRSNLKYGISSACIGGGQGIAILLENPEGEAIC